MKRIAPAVKTRKPVRAASLLIAGPAVVSLFIAACGPSKKDMSRRAGSGLVNVAGPTAPTRYIWRGAPGQGRAIEWIRVKLSPGKAGGGYRYVLGICAKRKHQPRPYCGGGACDRSRCPIKGGDAFAYRFLGRDPATLPPETPPATPLMEIRWQGRLKLRRPGPGQAMIELPAYNFRDGIRLRKED